MFRLVGGNTNSRDVFHLFFHWSYRTSLARFFLAIVIFLYSLTFIFAIILYLVALWRPQCLVVKGQEFHEAEGRFLDVWRLSWTTLFTVGYGIVAPQGNDRWICLVIHFCSALEAFSGIIAASMVSAVLFGKLARNQAIASVNFSKQIVTQIGPELVKNEDNDDSSIYFDKKKNRKRYPCPVIEFRIVNFHYGHAGAEIVNACVNVVAHTDTTEHIETQEETNHLTGEAMLTNGLSPGSLVQKLNKNINKRLSVIGPISMFGEESGPYNKKERQKQEIMKQLRELEKQFDSQRSDLLSEWPCPSGKEQKEPVNAQQNSKNKKSTDGSAFCDDREKRLFSPLELETDSHPYFKRVWIVRHSLNENSPILTKKARNIIEKNYGYWPHQMCNHESIHEYVKFHQLIVTISGTTNTAGSSVFGYKVYDFKDLAIGYSFQNILSVSEDGRLKIKLESIDAVCKHTSKKKN